MSKNATLPIDKHVGERVRMRRHMMKISQQALGDAIGITFQQVQKYEQGKNRIGAGRLQEISRVLNAPVSFFFQDAPILTPKLSGRSRVTGQMSINIVSDFLATTDGLRLCAAFTRIKSSAVRRSIVQLIERIVER